MHCAYVFPAVTVEEWNRVVAITEESMSAAVPEVKAKYMVPSTVRKRVTVHTPLTFIDKVMRPKDAEHFFEGGLSTIASLPASHLPIDQKCKKKPVMGFMFGEMYDVLKYPIINKADIERKCADKIPPDLLGSKRAENVKLSKALLNTTTEEHPCADKQTAVTFLHKAEEVGDYWKCKINPHYQPMSLEGAIWGNQFVQAMDLDTSTGAVLQMLYPGKTKKKDLIGE